MKYFAYGSNIKLSHFRAFIKTFGGNPAEITDPRHAILRGYRLRTNHYSSLHGAAACNIELSPADHVEGVVMTITEDVLRLLRVKEGAPAVYQEIDVDLALPKSCKAFTYVVTPQYALHEDFAVTAEYRNLILHGAKKFNFSPEYQEALRKQLKIMPSLRYYPRQKVGS